MAASEEYVCSPMTGQLVQSDGSPVVDTQIRREWHWHGKSGADTTRTDAQGRFSFGAVPAKRGFFGFLPAEDRVQQNYYADLPDGAFKFLYVSGSGLTLGHEADGKKFNVRCLTGTEPDGNGFHWGTCKLLP